MFDMPPVVYGGAGAIVMGAVGFVWILTRARRTGAPETPHTDARQKRLSDGAVERVVLPAIGWIAHRARRLTPAGRVRSLERKVRLAGSRSRWTLDRALAAKLSVAMEGGFAGFWYGGRSGSSAMVTYAVAGLIPNCTPFSRSQT